MKVFLCILSLIAISSAHANSRTIYPQALPCDPSSGGVKCNIYPSFTQNKSQPTPVYCGSTVVFLSSRQREVLNALLRENKNVTIKIKIDGEFVDASCF